MSPPNGGPGIPNRDDDVSNHISTWLNHFKELWTEAATREHDEGFAPAVPNVGAATEIEELTEILSVRANAVGFDYRQYLTSDRNLAELAVIDTLPEARDRAGETAVFDPSIIEEERSVLEHLIPADHDRSVVEKVRDTMETFRLLQDPGDFEPGGEFGVLSYDPSDPSEALKSQWADLDGALTTIFRDDDASKEFVQRARIRDLVFQNFNSNVTAEDQPVKQDILPPVSSGIHDHIAALLTEDVDVIRRMGYRLPVDGEGDQARPSNQFKVDDYQHIEERDKLGAPPEYIPWKMLPEGTRDKYDDSWTRTDEGKDWLAIDQYRWLDDSASWSLVGSGKLKDPQPDLFTSKATLANVGDDAFSVRGGSDAFTNYLPDVVKFVNESAEIEHTYSDILDKHFVWNTESIVGMEERKARFQRLGLLHALGQHPAYDANPAVLGSVLHHLLRFGQLRARLSAEGREVLLADDYLFDQDINNTAQTERAKISAQLQLTLTDLDVHGPEAELDVTPPDSDPRLAQLDASLRYLHRLEQEELERLLRETLDLASHRMDAWWTSLGTRRLAELRNEQDNWYVPSVDYGSWYESDPYLPPGPDPGEGPAAGALDRGPDDVVVADRSTELSQLDACLQHLRTLRDQLSGTDYLVSSSDGFDSAIGDTIDDFVNAFWEYVRPPGTFTRLRSEQLSYLDASVLDELREDETVSFLEWADDYVDSLPDDEDFTGVAYLAEYVRGSGDWSTSSRSFASVFPSPWDRNMRKYGTEPPVSESELRDPTSPFNQFSDDMQGWGVWAEGMLDHLIRVFEVARVAAETAAGDPQRPSESSEDGQMMVTADPDETSGVDPLTNESGVQVGAWGFVENLASDDRRRNPNIDQSEYIHAPSMEQATTAAILRGGHESFQAQGDSELTAIDLSPDRVRTAREILDGIREGQALGALLGYRFERALHEAGAQEHLQDFRKAFPKFTGTLGGADGADAAAKSDVVNGLRLYRSVADDGLFLRATDDYPDDLPQPADSVVGSSDEQIEVTWALEHLFDVVDALQDLLTAESVHQFAQGNYSRATASLETLADGESVPEPEFIKTPRTETGLTHRLLVTFGDASADTAAETDVPTLWNPNSRLHHPDIPAVGDRHDEVTVSSEVASEGGFHVQARADAEPNLNAWVGDLLPAPDRVGCEADFEWTEDRTFATGSFTTPRDGGRVSVTDLGFEPDVILFTAATGIEQFDGAGGGTSDGGPVEEDDGGTAYGWTHGKCSRTTDGSLVQNSVSVGHHTAAAEAVGTADEGRALNIVVKRPADDAGSYRNIEGRVRETTPDGFELQINVPEEGRRGVAVEYVAFESGDRTTVEVGSFETPTSSVSFGVDADHVSLTTTDAVDAGNLDDGEEVTRESSSAVGLCHGEVVGDGSPDQHAVSVTHGPAGSDKPTIAASEGSAIHLPSELEVSVGDLGKQMTLNYDTGGSEETTSRVVTYVAVGTDDADPTPEIGVVAEGNNQVVGPDEEFTPACIEFLAIRGGGAGFGTGSPVTAAPSAAGWSHGVASGPGRQRVVHSALEPGTGVERKATRGSVVSLPVGEPPVTATLESVDDRGFTVRFPDGKPDDVLVLYRARPKTPTEREHVVPASLQLSDLELSPLDATFSSVDAAAESRTQLEERLAYHFHRNADAAVDAGPGSYPPIPTDAPVSLRLRDAGGGAISVAEVVEVVRTLRELVTEGKSADADDFAPPAERAGSGYDRSTHEALSDRAERAHEALRDVERQLENRIGRLTPPPASDDERPPAVSEQVDRVRDELTAFREDVPISGIVAAVNQVSAATSDDEGVLQTELSALLDRLPAGASDPNAADEPLTVQRLTGQTVAGVADVSGSPTIDIRVESATVADAFDAGTGGREFVKTAKADCDSEGRFEAAFDFHDAPPGARFDVAAVHNGSVVFAASGRVVDPAQPLVIDPGQTDPVIVEAETDLAAGTELTATLESHTHDAPGKDTLDVRTPTDIKSDGSFRAEFDASTAVKRSAVSVTVTDNQGNVVYSVDGYVRDPADEESLDAMLESFTVVPRLLWLARQRDSLDPSVDGSAAASLRNALEGDDVNWTAITAETDLFEDWKREAAGSPTDIGPRIDDDDVTELSTLDSLSSTTLGGEQLAVPIGTAVGPVKHTVGPAVDLTGGDAHPDDVRFWLSSDGDQLGAARSALLNLLHDPAAPDSFNQTELQLSPAFTAFAAGAGPGSTPLSASLADRVPAYFSRLFEHGAWIVDDLSGAVDRPDQFLSRLRKLAYRPEQFHADGDWSSLEGDIDEVVTYYRSTTTSLPELSDALSTVQSILDDKPSSAQTPGELSDIEERLQDMRDHLSRRQLADDVRIAEENAESLLSGASSNWPSKQALEDLKDELGALADRIDTPEPLNPLDGLAKTVFDGVGDGKWHDLSGTRTKTASTGTEFVHLLSELRGALGSFESDLAGGTGVYDAADARAGFDQWWKDAVVLDEDWSPQSGDPPSATRVVNDTLEPLDGDRSVRFDETFRRCLLETLRVPMLRASHFGIYASIPRHPTGGTPDHEEALLSQARGIAERIGERLSIASDHETEATDWVGVANDRADENASRASVREAYAAAAEEELARLEALFDDAFEVLPPLSLPNQPEVSDTFAGDHTEELLSSGDRMETETWLQRTARVRERPALFREALSYSEMLTDRLLRDGLSVGQLPFREPDDWVGLEGITPEPGQVSLVTTFASRAGGRPIAANPGTREGQTGVQVAALRVDEWRTSVPAGEETTGVAMNYDDPNTEPPQSLLLAVLPEDETWSTETLLQTILETTDLAKIRGVDLQQLGKPAAGSNPQRVPGHFLPALTFPLNTHDTPDVPSVDFTLDQEIAGSLLPDWPASTEGGDD